MDMETSASTSRCRRHSVGPGASSPTTSEPPLKRPQTTHDNSDNSGLPSLPLRRLSEVTGWIAHTLNAETTKKTPISVDTKREKVEELQTLVSSISTSYSALEARLDESRLVPPTMVKSFAQTLAERDAAFDVRLADYIETHLPQFSKLTSPATPVDTFAEKVKARTSRSNAASADASGSSRQPADAAARSKARSKSRAKKGLEKLATSRAVSPAFVLANTADKSASTAQAELWAEVSKRSRAPKVLSLRSRNGNIILKPQDKETNDVLKAITKSKGFPLREDLPRRPRVIISNVPSDLPPNELPSRIAQQNPSLGVSDNPLDSITPIFKRGPRDRDTVSWIFEVSPEIYPKLTDSHIYLGFMRCRTAKFEQVTQCLRCLRHGHPAANCSAATSICALCAHSGHLQSECPSKHLPPKCANCSGSHSALDRTCSKRTAAIANLLARTYFGPSTPAQ